MARRSKISTLPAEVLAWLDGALVQGSFSGYEALAEALRERGFEISRSAIHRHGQALQAQHQEAMASARELLALTRASGELAEAGSEISRHGAVIMQSEVLRTSLEIRREEDPEKRASLLAKLTRAQADLGRMIISADKWKLDLQGKIAAKMDELEAQAKGTQGKAGFDIETLRRVRQEIYGLV